MTVLALTLSYRKLLEYGESQTPVLSYKQKKTIAVFGIVSFIAITIVYLYLMGEVVTQNYEHNRLSVQLQQASSRAQEIEQQALGINSVYTSEYFIEHGYTKPNTLGIIKRASNVAEVQISYLYQ